MSSIKRSKTLLCCLALIVVLCGAKATEAQTGPDVASLTLSASSVRGGQSVTGTVRLEAAAPAGGATVMLDDAGSPLVTLSASVTVPAGATTVGFNVTTASTLESDAARIMAYRNGGLAQTAYLTVTPHTHVAPEFRNAWAAYYDGPAGLRDGEYPVYVDTDAGGNVYVAGTSYMDPTNRRGDKDISVVKYDAQGNQLWAQRWAGAAGYIDITWAMKVDAEGNVHVAGSTWKRLSAEGGTEYDYVTLKYDTFGNLLWARYYDGPIHLNDDPRAIELDAQGNVYVTGWSWNGEIGVRIAAGFATVKYDRDGNQLWVRRFDGYNSQGAGANALAVDSAGAVYVAGHVMRADSGGNDLYTIKYDASGNQLWAHQLNTPEESSQQEQTFFLKLGPQGDVYLAGCSWRFVDERLDYLLVKYDSAGRHLWTRSWGTPLDEKPYGMDIDAAGNVYVSGTSDALHPNFNDTVTAKFDPAGSMLWRRRFNGSMNEWDHNRGVKVDPDGNAFVLVAEQERPGLIHYTVVKYSPSGTELWTHSTPGAGGAAAYPTSLSMDGAGNLYIAGEGPQQAGSANNDFYTVKLERATTTAPAAVALSQLTVSPASVVGGGPAHGTVKLTGAAPAGGLVVTLSDNLANATLPAQVTVPAGSSSQAFTITTSAVTAAQTGTVTAVHNNVSKTAALSVTPAHSISGAVLNGTAGLGGVQIRLTSTTAGFTPQTATTAASTGAYSFTNLPAGRSYVVTAASPVYNFTPASRSIASLAGSVTGQNFSVQSRKSYAISGRVTLGGAGMGGVALQFRDASGAVIRTVTTATSSAGVSGSYSFAGVPAGYNYRVTPAASAVYSYTPLSRLYSNLSSAQTGQDFTAARKTYNISGRVVKSGTTNGIGGVTLTLKTGAGSVVKTVTTLSDGAYSIVGVPAGASYTLTPARSGMTFSPAYRSFANLSSNKTAQNFSGS